MIRQTDPLEYFRLKPSKAATVSEVSEATASSDVPPEERVNFHIGNPVQDKKLSSAYLRTILGLPISSEEITEDNLKIIIDELGLSGDDTLKLEFFRDLIKNSAPYMPRGGFNRKSPNFLVEYFNEWLTRKQPESLSYDLGETSGKREIILASGGINEAFRLLFHSLSNFLIIRPAGILYWEVDLPEHLISYAGLNFKKIPAEEEALLGNVRTLLKNSPQEPAFLILGRIPGENTRRELRKLSLEFPLFFIEVNNAPNHTSLAREAKMMNRVLRIFTPGIFSGKLNNFSVVFIAGNSEYIRVIETIHFQLKGTPSASEVELLTYILKNDLVPQKNSAGERSIVVKPAREKSLNPIAGENTADLYAEQFGNRLNELIQNQADIAERITTRITEKEQTLVNRSGRLSSFLTLDKFSGTGAPMLLDQFIENIDSSEWSDGLINSFLFSFLKHHPEYNLRSSLLVSGSSRTGLGLLGFYCGIREVIIPDLSWTYEHCFPSVCVVPLTDRFEIDVDAIIDAVNNKISSDPHWREYGAVALNNPHNATGQEFNPDEVKRLIKWLLEKKIFIIDDLSYQNVAPLMELREIKTARQLANELHTNGYIDDEQSNYLITIHSMSKTDSLAGARLSVIEVRHPEIYDRYRKINSTIRPNLAAVFLTYLFYRNSAETVDAYWRLRNRIFFERMSSISEAVATLPRERNKFDIIIRPPRASMYPQMIIDKLPAGLSLDWLASGLARQGIGMIPLSTFARTEKGFEAGRKTFRLTLGGTDGASVLMIKTRRMLIHLNRMISEEANLYARKEFPVKAEISGRYLRENRVIDIWQKAEKKIKAACSSESLKYFSQFNESFRDPSYKKSFENEYLPGRLSAFEQRFTDRIGIINRLKEAALEDKGKSLIALLEKEFFKDSLEMREKAFKERLYDRTVHPTQMYSIKVETLFDKLIDQVIKKKTVSQDLLDKIAGELIKEFLGLNVAIVSNQESSELLLDLNSIITAEMYTELHSGRPFRSFLSFWGDWDGSNRPSGQGHSLVASVLIENVVRQAGLLRALLEADRSVKIDPLLLNEIEKLSVKNVQFSKLLSQITQLTHQLEKRYRGILPFNLKPGKLRRVGMKLHIASDPLTSLWHHNDRLERKMLELRLQRRKTLEYYFSINKQLRKALNSLLPAIQKNLGNDKLLTEACSYRDLMKRFIITPRIHQKMITAQDQFAIDTTVHNINEINEIAGKYGNPGMVMVLQVSMSTRPEALIFLDRKMRSRREQNLRVNQDSEIPSIWLVPLFEDLDAVKNLKNYLNKIWEYGLQSRRLNQEKNERFSEIISEIFVAGSDLSQQVGQAAGMSLYKEAKFDLASWLAEKGLIGKVRMKMGSGEPMQRQGAYYSPVAGKPAFIHSADSIRRFSTYLKESTRKSTQYATTPLIGVFAGGDLRTLQSNVSERLRYLSAREFSQLLFHIEESQRHYEAEITGAGEPLVETRLQFKTRGFKELERLTIGRKDNLYNEFLSIFTSNFRQILYGREEDVVGIHVVSYFIARTTPPLRDRPTIRPGHEVSGSAGQKILEKIAKTIPLSKYGSLLRAIAHNQAQTAVLGINQLTTGLFRALDSFSQKQFIEGEPLTIIQDRILPKLPVHEILHTLRIYQDIDLRYLSRIENALPAGNSAFLALSEDMDAMKKYLILFQRELLRRHGLNVEDFFEADKFISDLLPTLRPDLAVLMQNDLFNTNPGVLLSSINGKVDDKWILEVKKLLAIPEAIRFWQARIWDLLEKPVFQQVESFVELAGALHSLSSNGQTSELPFSQQRIKLPSDVTNLFKASSDDRMHQFLAAAFEYLSIISEGMIEVPINIIRAIKEVERIIRIEEQALSPKQQDILRFYLLQIAHLTGENG
ncbi:MAG: aminotransferase class I/II-fold pyridoxal phosphate-dependent enzyme [Ignavibacteriales bacterium]